MSVSVALCTYNGSKFINEQVDSLVNQTLPPDEIVVCDDNSKDDTLAKIAAFQRAYPNISFVIKKNERNLGVVKNFEQAAVLSHGDIIFFCDQDDVWDLNKIRRVVDCFTAHPSAYMVCHDALIVDENLKSMGTTFWQIAGISQDVFAGGNYSRLLKGSAIQGSSIAFRRSLLHEAVPFSDSAFHDEWMSLNAANQGDIIMLPDLLIKYRQSGHNAVGIAKHSVWERCMTYRRSYREKLEDHFHKLNRRKRVFDDLAKNNLNEPFKTEINRARMVLAGQIAFIQGQSHRHSYRVLKQFYGKQLGQKQYVKDMLGRIVLR